jgi:methylated-DNA-[protein]-cysteine S-methyltransferase
MDHACCVHREGGLVSISQCAQVSTYGALARTLKSAARAVGQALRCNPYAPTVPCHRVVAAGGCIGGFSGQSDPSCAALGRKVSLLKAEGVLFDSAGKVSGTCIITSFENV